MTPRYLRHFNPLWCVDYSQASLERIFSTILAWHLEPFPGEVKALCNQIVAMTAAIYQVRVRVRLRVRVRVRVRVKVRVAAKCLHAASISQVGGNPSG